MAGSSVTTVNGVERESERVRLFARGDSLVYEATPSGQSRTEFTAASAGEEVRFSNLAHDFPHHVIYRRVGVDSIVARIEGLRGGQTASVTFAYQKVRCPP